eukprot:TRINITY_DN5111_c1_g1_i2.p1 TRINITY_DN5111_c1_g1~~TRINITY_DN5111_c1_g1_i2.p1  ORF type:complete len:697 (-),score=177.16 TRINITY_DN5111_c1_g1_i2:178-2268(-)
MKFECLNLRITHKDPSNPETEKEKGRVREKVIAIIERENNEWERPNPREDDLGLWIGTDHWQLSRSIWKIKNNKNKLKVRLFDIPEGHNGSATTLKFSLDSKDEYVTNIFKAIKEFNIHNIYDVREEFDKIFPIHQTTRRPIELKDEESSLKRIKNPKTPSTVKRPRPNAIISKHAQSEETLEAIFDPRPTSTGAASFRGMVKKDSPPIKMSEAMSSPRGRQINAMTKPKTYSKNPNGCRPTSILSSINTTLTSRIPSYTPKLNSYSNTLHTYFSQSQSQSQSQSLMMATRFQNLGNTCYLNAVLQSLTSLQPFTEELKLGNERLEISGQSFYSCLLEIVTEIESEKNKVINPHRVKDAIAKNTKRFAGYGQQDAHEFLSSALSQVEEDAVKPIRYLSAKNDQSEILLLSETCPINRNFNTIIKKEFTCQECQDVTSVMEIYRDFSLDFSGKKPGHRAKIEDLLHSFFQPDVVAKKCEKCECETATVNGRIYGLPRILILHLKRFEANFEKQTYDKISEPVQPATTLDLSPFCTDDTRNPPSFAYRLKKDRPSTNANASKDATTSSGSQDDLDRAIQESLKSAEFEKEFRIIDTPPDDDRTFEIADVKNAIMIADSNAAWEDTTNRSYHLQSIVTHLGSSASSGHYVTDVLDPEKGEWTNFSDSIAKKRRSQMEALMDDRNSYLFFYVHQSCWFIK